MNNGTSRHRRAIRKVFKQNPGLQAELSRELGIGPSAISMWVHGRSPSRRLDTEVPRLLAERGKAA